MSNYNQSVRWQDGTYDFERVCQMCFKTDCTTPAYSDRYKEIEVRKLPEVYEHDGKVDFAEPIKEEQDIDMPQITAIGEEAYRSLTLKQQRAWNLCMRQHMTEREAAAQMGIEQPPLHRLLSRAKAAYTAYLREHTI